jgi:hypothetical protein
VVLEEVIILPIKQRALPIQVREEVEVEVQVLVEAVDLV